MVKFATAVWVIQQRHGWLPDFYLKVLILMVAISRDVECKHALKFVSVKLSANLPEISFPDQMGFIEVSKLLFQQI